MITAKQILSISIEKSSKYFIAPFRSAICCMLFLFGNSECFAIEEPDYDEIPVFLTVAGVGSVEIPAVVKDNKVYLPVNYVFDFLKIKTVLSPALDSATVYLNGSQAHIIDQKNNRIIAGKNILDLKNNEIIRTDFNLYLLSDCFGPAFGLECTFNFRSLSVYAVAKIDLPVLREMRQEALRNNIKLLKGELRADTSIRRKAALFHFGTADWSVINTKEIKGTDNLRFNLTLGASLAGGETTVSLNYDNSAPFTEKQQYYLWRHVNNERRGLKQILAGKIFTQSISSIFSPVVGVQFTNTPTTYRRSFGNYVISDRTEPNWTVELYVNNVLVNYVKADASGFFTFEVPLVYGVSVIKLRFYGPYGEERTTEQNINIPFNFVPKHQLEYTVSAGMVEDSLNSRFSKAQFNYGLGSRITIGAGMEYLSSVSTGQFMPFANASFRLASNLLMSAEYLHNVRMRNILSWRSASNLQVELSYSKYKEGQKAINNTFLEEKKAVVSFPFRSSRFSLFSRLSLYQVKLPSSKYTTAESLFSGVVFGVSTNLTTYFIYNEETDAYVYSNLSSTFRMPGKLIFTPQVQYEYNKKELISLKGEMGKYLSYRGYVNVFYEKNYKSNFQSIGVGVRYDLSFAQIGISARHGNNKYTLVQTAKGSMIYDGKTNYVNINNRSSVGKGGISLSPYLDLNSNGRRDKGEPAAPGLRIQINAGRVFYNRRDTVVLITGLEAYATYLIKLNTDGFENIGWQIKHRTINITVNPNQFETIEIPVLVTGEASGTVYQQTANGQKKGLGRIVVNLYRSDSTFVSKMISEADGFFSFTSLQPGSYIAMIDTAQLQKLNMTATPSALPFMISSNPEGDIVEELEFVISTPQNLKDKHD